MAIYKSVAYYECDTSNMSQTCLLECEQITVMHTKLWSISHTHATHLSAHRINANGDTSMRAPSIIN